MSDTKADCEQLLNALMPFVQRMLVEHGEFWPVGAVLSLDGELSLAAVADEDDSSDSENLYEMFETQLHEEAKSGKHKATAIVYNGMTVPPEREIKQDTIVVVLDHRNNYSMKVCFPYTLDAGKLDMENPFAVEGEYKIFGTN